MFGHFRPQGADSLPSAPLRLRLWPGERFATLLAGAILILALGAGAQSGVAAQPRLTLDPLSLELGTLSQDETVNSEITIRNDGDAPLVIQEVRSSCGCTVTDLKTTELAPGESTPLIITFHSEKFQGEQNKSIQIVSNDPQNGERDFEIHAYVHVPVMVFPKRRSVGLGYGRAGEHKPGQVLFESHDVPELQLSLARYNEDVFDIQLQPSYEDNPQKVALIARTKSTAPPGNYREFVRVRTNVPEMATIDIEVFAEVVLDLQIDKDKINFRYAQRDKPLESQVQVQAVADDVTFKVTGAEIDLPNFEVRVEEKAPNRETIVYISGYPLETTDPRAQAAQGRMMGTLRIFTDLPSQPELQIKVIYLLRM
jgi:hypothetical protein